MGWDVASGGWRREVLDAVMLWTVRLGAVLASVLLLSLLAGPARLLDPGILLMYGSYAGVVALRFQPRLAYGPRVAAFCALCFVTGAAGLFSLGILPGPTLVCAFVVIAARLFSGPRAMQLALAATALAVVLASARHGIEAVPGASGWFRDIVWLRDIFWLRSAVAYAMPTAAIAMLVGYVVSQIERSLQNAAEALLRSQSAEAEREQAQQALATTERALLRSQKLEAVGRLASGVGHDFNNTLQVLLSWASILKGERDEHTLAEGLSAIENAALQGRELTQRLLAFGRRDVRAPALCSPGELVRESARSLRRLLPEDIRVDVHLDAGTPRLLIDPDQLGHVLLNLGLNARDAMPSGGTLEMRVGSLQASELPKGVALSAGVEHVAAISVRDTGTGMSAETLGHLFEPFYTTKGERGTGLGLATAYSLVQRNGGAIRVESVQGEGSSFHLYFPEGHEPGVVRERPSRAPRPVEKGLVMVAEDDAEVRRTMVHVLRSAGYRVLESADTSAAMSLVEQRGGEVDVLCTDGIMPGGSTGRLIDHYLSRRPSGQVIVCSGHVREELLRRDLDAGAHAYLPKPFHTNELVERIDRLLEAR